MRVCHVVRQPSRYMSSIHVHYNEHLHARPMMHFGTMASSFKGRSHEMISRLRPTSFSWTSMLMLSLDQDSLVDHHDNIHVFDYLESSPPAGIVYREQGHSSNIIPNFGR